MKLRHRPTPPPPELGEDTVLLLLLGDGARSLVRVSVFKQLQFTADANLKRVAALWREHEDVCLAEAKRRRLTRPQDADLGRAAWFGEYACETVAKFPQRFGGA